MHYPVAHHSGVVCRNVNLTRVTKRNTLVFAVASLLGIGAVLIVMFSSISPALLYGARSAPQRQLQRTIAENLKTGATQQRVLDFLNREHLEHGPAERLGDFDSDTRYYPKGTLIVRAIKRHTASGLIGFQSLQVVFVFNENRELVRFDVRPVYTAP